MLENPLPYCTHKKKKKERSYNSVYKFQCQEKLCVLIQSKTNRIGKVISSFAIYTKEISYKMKYFLLLFGIKGKENFLDKNKKQKINDK